ncbi:MAG: hypothetical protein ACLUPK_09290 [Veillonella sp.]
MVVTHHSSTNYRPQFYFHTTDVTGVVELPEGVEMVMPGDQRDIRNRIDLTSRYRTRFEVYCS